MDQEEAVRPGVAVLPSSFVDDVRYTPARLLDVEVVVAQRLRRGRGIEFVTNFVIYLAAVGLGMKALYFSDLTWGGWEQFVTAALWGLGVHQFAYGGFGSLMDKLVKPER